MTETIKRLSVRPVELIKQSLSSPIELAAQSVLVTIGIVGAVGLSYAIAGPRRF